MNMREKRDIMGTTPPRTLGLVGSVELGLNLQRRKDGNNEQRF